MSKKLNLLNPIAFLYPEVKEAMKKAKEKEAAISLPWGHIDDIYAPILEFFSKIGRVIRWIPAIYRDQDFDYCFAIELLIFKLHRMRKCILKNGVIEDAQQIHDEILEAANKLQAVLDDDWCFDEIDAMWKRNGGEPGFFKQLEFLKAHPAVDKEYHALLRKHNETSEAKFKEAFDFLRDNIRKWWD